MDMDAKFHIHGKPGNSATEYVTIAEDDVTFAGIRMVLLC